MIPNRKPATPLMELYAYGTYKKSLREYNTGKRHQAYPSVAAL